MLGKSVMCMISLNPVHCCCSRIDNTIDQNAIIDFHPDMVNVIMANGFSGHGLQQSPAAGRAVSELISCDGRFETLDLSIFSFERVCQNRPIFETGIV